jgi:O-antigen/teichoic acid export membrane protein
MCLWAAISGAMTVESCLLAALNRTRLQAVLSIVAAALNVGLSVHWVRQVGSVGVIGGTIASYLVVLVIPQSLIVNRVLKKMLVAPKRAVPLGAETPFLEACSITQG